MKVIDRHPRRMLVVQLFRRRRVQQEVLIQKRLHVRFALSCDWFCKRHYIESRWVSKRTHTVAHRAHRAHRRTPSHTVHTVPAELAPPADDRLCYYVCCEVSSQDSKDCGMYANPTNQLRPWFRQGTHALALLTLMVLVGVSGGIPEVRARSAPVVSGAPGFGPWSALWTSIAIAVIHQLWVTVWWRMQIARAPWDANTGRVRVVPPRAALFRVYEGVFFLLFAALISAAFQHAYIWVHYWCTELPDMRAIYGSHE